MRSLYPAEVRPHFVLDNFSPHKGQQVRDWAHDNNVELAYTPHYASWPNRMMSEVVNTPIIHPVITRFNTNGRSQKPMTNTLYP